MASDRATRQLRELAQELGQIEVKSQAADKASNKLGDSIERLAANIDLLKKTGYFDYDPTQFENLEANLRNVSSAFKEAAKLSAQGQFDKAFTGTNIEAFVDRLQTALQTVTGLNDAYSRMLQVYSVQKGPDLMRSLTPSLQKQVTEDISVLQTGVKQAAQEASVGYQNIQLMTNALKEMMAAGVKGSREMGGLVQQLDTLAQKAAMLEQYKPGQVVGGAARLQVKGFEEKGLQYIDQQLKGLAQMDVRYKDIADRIRLVISNLQIAAKTQRDMLQSAGLYSPRGEQFAFPTSEVTARQTGAPGGIQGTQANPYLGKGIDPTLIRNVAASVGELGQEVIQEAQAEAQAAEMVKLSAEAWDRKVAVLERAAQAERDATAAATQVRNVPVTQVTPPDPVTARIITGTPADIKRTLSDQEALSKQVNSAISLLESKWQQAGVTLQRFKVQVDAANQALRVQADVATQTAQPLAPAGPLSSRIAQPTGDVPVNVVGSGLAQLTYDLRTMQEVTKPDQIKSYLGQLGLGDAAFKNLSNSIQKSKVSMDSYVDAQTQANSGLTTFRFATVNATGAVDKHNVIMDRNGAIVSTVKQKYEGFGSAITNNIQKVLRWGIAVGAVYGTLRRVQDAISEMITLQSAQADIQIITGQSASQIASSMNELAVAAERTGMTLGQAAEVYQQALRAAGRYADEQERMAKANVLVTDALVLARLGNLDAAKSLDTLVGALRQQGLELDQASNLLDKWVVTSNIAKVAMGDLAESFAITASQARAVGVDVDTLNGVIGTLAEVTTLSSTEIGNLARTLFSSLENETAVNTLRDYGVAVKDSAGEFRSWQDIIQDVYDLLRAGAIDEKDISAIGAALGGGARRGPQVVAFIKEYGRVNEIAAQSAAANGEAADALDIKMETLSNTVNKFQVALSELARAAGQEGGVLDLLTKIVDLATWVVEKVGTMTSAFEGLTTQLITLGVAYAALKKFNLGGIGAGIGGALSKIPTPGIPGFGGSPYQSRLDTYVSRDASKSAGEAMSGGFGQAMRGLAPGIGSAIGTAAGIGLITYAGTGSAAQAAGAGIGGAIGTVLGGPVGTVAGAVIGQTIANTFQNNMDQSTLAASLARDFAEGTDLNLEKGLQYFTDIANDFRDIGDRLANRGPIMDGRQFIPQWGDRRPEDILEFARAYLKREQEAVPEWVRTGEDEFAREERAADAKRFGLMEALIAAIDKEINAVEENTAAQQEQQISPLAEQFARIRRQYEPGLEEALRGRRGEKIQEFAAGEIPRAEYTRFLENMERAPLISSQMLDLLGVQMAEVFGTGQAAFEEMGLTVAELDPNALDFIADRLQKLAGIRSEMSAITEDTTATASQLAYAAELSRQYGTEAAIVSEEIVALIENAKRAAEEEMHRPAFTRRPEEFTPDVAARVQEVALANQEIYAEMFGLDPDMFAASADAITEIWGDGMLHRLEGIHKIFWDDAVQLAIDAMQQMEEAQFSVRRLKDVDPSRFGEIQQRNRYWIEYLSRLQGMSAEQYLGKEGYTENLILGPNNVWQKLLTTNEAMSFTLQDILETEKKQLEGMWNIPTGATFWVPLTSLFYQNQGGGGGVPELPPINEELLRQIQNLEDAMRDLRIKGYDEKVVTEEEEEEAPRGRTRYLRGRGRRGMGRGEGVDLADREGNELIQALKEFVGRSETPADMLTKILAALQIVQMPEAEPAEGLLGFMTDAINEASLKNAQAFLSEAISPLFEKAYTSKLDEPGEYAVLEQAIQELLAGYQKDTAQVGSTAAIEGVANSVQSTFTTLSTAVTALAERPTAEINLRLPDVSREIVIHNTITLDGSVIKRFLSRYLATEVGRSAKAAGFSGAT